MEQLDNTTLFVYAGYLLAMVVLFGMAGYALIYILVVATKNLLSYFTKPEDKDPYNHGRKIS